MLIWYIKKLYFQFITPFKNVFAYPSLGTYSSQATYDNWCPLLKASSMESQRQKWAFKGRRSFFSDKSCIYLNKVVSKMYVHCHSGEGMTQQISGGSMYFWATFCWKMLSPITYVEGTVIYHLFQYHWRPGTPIHSNSLLWWHYHLSTG